MANLSARASVAIGLILWVVAAFLAAQVLVGVLYNVLAVYVPGVTSLNEAVVVTIFAAAAYALSVALVVGVPFVLMKRRTSLKLLGIDRLPTWGDIGMSLLSILPYFLFSAVLAIVVGALWSGFNPNQPQSLPFSNLALRYEYVVAFITLVVLAPLAEELLFRGYLQGKVRSQLNKWLSVLLVAVVFGSLHLIGDISDNGVVLQWSAGLDTFALGVVLGILREFTGSIWAGVLLHMMKNSLAFYFLFINPVLAGTL